MQDTSDSNRHLAYGEGVARGKEAWEARRYHTEEKSWPIRKADIEGKQEIE